MWVMVRHRDRDHATFSVFFYIGALCQVLACIFPIAISIELAQLKSADQFILDGGAVQHVHKERTRSLQAEKVTRHAAEAAAERASGAPHPGTSTATASQR